MNVYSDYNNIDNAPGQTCGPDNGCTINTNVFQEFVPNPLFNPNGGIDASNIGQSWTFSFDVKSPFAGGIFDGTAANPNGGDYNNPQSASAFIKTLDPNNGFATTNDVRVETTGVSNTDWTRLSIFLDLTDPLLAGQILQFGFNTVSTEYGDSGVYYDNICWSTNGDDCSFTDVSAVPVPAAVWLFGSGLLGLVGVARRKVS